jgi:hypothetical protein
MQKGLAVLLFLVGCSGDRITQPPPTPADAELIAPRLATVAVAIAVGSQGRGFLDNFIPCGRRGIINYYNETSDTRAAKFSGCDVGNGVTVDGEASVRWSGVRNQPVTTPTSVLLTGDLLVNVSGRASRVTELTVNNVRFTTSQPDIFRLIPDSLRIELAGGRYSSSVATSPRVILDPRDLHIGSLPNPSASLSALSDADIKRLAFDAGLKLAWYLASNVRQEDPGPTAIQTACGVTHVGWDADQVRTYFLHEWEECTLGFGMLVTGSFQHRLPGPFVITTSLPMIAAGLITFGGAVPMISLTRFEWTITIVEIPGNARVAGLLKTATEEKHFSFTIYIDD